MKDLDLLMGGVGSPHLGFATKYEPEFFDRSMFNRGASLACCKLEVRHAPAGETEQNANIRPVWGGDRGIRRQLHGGKREHALSRSVCSLT